MSNSRKGELGKPVQINYHNYFTFSSAGRTIDVLSSDEFRSLIQTRYADNPEVIESLGSANTNWQNEIYKNVFGHNHNLSFKGATKKIPYYASIGHTNQDGVLETSGFKRTTSILNLSPKLFNKHLNIDFGIKGMFLENNFADPSAIISAIAFDPTQPVYNTNSSSDDYFYYSNTDGLPMSLAPRNPVALLDLQEEIANVQRMIWNFKLDYKLHFFPDLRLKFSACDNLSKSEKTLKIDKNASWIYNSYIDEEIELIDYQKRRNKIRNLALNYNKDLRSIHSKIDINTGYLYQSFWREDHYYISDIESSSQSSKNYLVSFFGMLNVSFMNKYILNYSLRYDGSSRFSIDERWKWFPAFGVTWKISHEAFMENLNFLSRLNLRFNWGRSGNQDLIPLNTPVFTQYVYAGDLATYQFGDDISSVRPASFDLNLKWEKKTSMNFGIDYGFFKERIYGDINIYKNTTVDLMHYIPVDAGTNLTNTIMTNFGSIENKGAEISIELIPLINDDFKWEFGYNFAYNINKITELISDDSYNLIINTGSISGGVGNTIQVHSLDYPAYSFYSYYQYYDQNGEPIEGLYVDKNQDGEINYYDRYALHKPHPDMFMGISSRFNYKKLEFSFSGRINIGNYLYNNVESNTSIYNHIYHSNGCLSNILENPSVTFENPQYLSSHFIQNASFFRMDHITLAYIFKNVVKNKINLKVYTTAQNLLLITKYNGTDPEIPGGIDKGLYPHPRLFLVGFRINFQ